MERRNIWLENEVRVMLQVFRELNITKLIDGKKYKNQEIFKKVHEEMVKLGITSKSADQIKNKWKALKTAFNNVKKNNNQSGAERATCEFFSELNEILGNRPAYSIDGIDSQRQDPENSQTDQEFQEIAESNSAFLEPLENFEIEVDPTITQEELDTTITQANTNNETNLEVRREIRESRKRKYGESSKSKDEVYFKYHREVLKEFFENQREIEERAAKQRTSDLKLVLNTFTKTMENIMKWQVPPGPGLMPYSYMPFGPPSSSGSQDSSSSTKAPKKSENNGSISSDNDNSD